VHPETYLEAVVAYLLKLLDGTITRQLLHKLHDALVKLLIAGRAVQEASA